MRTLYVIDLPNYSEGRHILILNNENMCNDEVMPIKIPENLTYIGIIRFIREVLLYTEDEYEIQLYGHTNISPNIIIPATIHTTNHPVYEVRVVNNFSYYVPPIKLPLVITCISNTSKQLDLGDTFSIYKKIPELIQSGFLEPNCDVYELTRYRNRDFYIIRDGNIVEKYTNLPL